MARLSVMILLDRLEELLSGHRLLGRTWVETDAALELTQKIRATLPDEIREAEWLTSEKERLIFEAQEEAKRILRDAENYAAKLVQDSQIVRQAQHEAEAFLAEARRKRRPSRRTPGLTPSTSWPSSRRAWKRPCGWCARARTTWRGGTDG